MSTPAKPSADPTDPSSFAEPIQDLTPPIEEPSERQIEDAVQSVKEDANSKAFDENRFRPRPRPSHQPSESLPGVASRSAKIYWWLPTLAIALAGLGYILLGDNLRFPWASPGSRVLAQKKGAPAKHEVAKLTVNQATPRPMDQPVPLGVSVDNADDLSILKISGLPKGTTLSAGISAIDDGWLLYATDIKDA
jgi:hypothetical protein